MAGREKGAYTKSEDLPNAVVIPRAEDRVAKEAYIARFIDVPDFPKDGQECRYEAGVYTALASGRMKGHGDADIMLEAAKLTRHAEESGTSFEALIERVNNGGPNIKKTTGMAIEKPAESAPSPALSKSETVVPVSQKTAEQELFDLLPKVRVSFQGSFGIFHTRYHEVSDTGNYLVLLFDQRCSIADMYSPPPMRGVMEVTVGTGEKNAKIFYVMSLGISFELEKRQMYIITLPLVPEDHALVQDYLSKQQEETVSLSPFAEV